MHIAFSADDNYAQHLGVTLASLLMHLRPGVVPHIYIIDGGISAQNKARIEELKSIRDFRVEYLTIDPAEYTGFPLTARHKSVAIYFRLKLPQLLPHLDKVLYLDIDIVVEDDLFPLYETALEPDIWLAAVFEPDVNVPFTTSIGMDRTDLYFNSGVMVMNLAALRNIDFDARCRNFAFRYHDAILYLDQDVLNYVCRGHVQALDPRFNLIAHFSNKAGRVQELNSCYDSFTINRAIKHPAIVHFLGKYKPWVYRCYVPFAGKYMEYIKHTPWKDYRYPDRNIRTVIAKFFYTMKKKRKE